MVRSVLIVIALTGLFVFSAFGQFIRPDIRYATETWNSMWLSMSNFGTFGGGDIPCERYATTNGCEMPPGSGTQYLFMAGLWIGAEIYENGTYIPRVSTSLEGWANPSINEMWPAEVAEYAERSLLDTTNCEGVNIYSPDALSHHEFEMVFFDTLTDEFYVNPDYDGTPHRPLGLKIDRTVYATHVEPCSYTYWIRHRIVNIGTQILRDVYLGYFGESGIGNVHSEQWWDDDIAGFEPTRQIAYIVDNDGRPSRDSTGENFTVPGIAGLIYLTSPGAQKISFNWWTTAADFFMNYGPSWSEHNEGQDPGGTPMGDAAKYRMLSNGEIDFDQIRVNDFIWISTHPQDGHEWLTPDYPDPDDLANGHSVHYLYSIGPFGEEIGYNRRLMPGDSFDVWMAIVGGRNFHDSRFPQPVNGAIDPALFNWDDLFYHADMVRENLCVPWLDANDRTITIPSRFMLDPVWPNPFNSRTNLLLHLNRGGEVEIFAYDILGREAARILDSRLDAGEHLISWNAADLPSGIYLIQARAHDEIMVQKAVLLK